MDSIELLPVFQELLRAHAGLGDDVLSKLKGTSELAFHSGMSVGMAEGSHFNFKITTPEDLRRFESIVCL